jgi:hypothetical protein
MMRGQPTLTNGSIIMYGASGCFAHIFPYQFPDKVMDRIVCSVTITNVSDPSKSLRGDALGDTGATFVVLPSAWKDRLGGLEVIDTIALETATQEIVSGEIHGPVRIQREGFRPISMRSCSWI